MKPTKALLSLQNLLLPVSQRGGHPFYPEALHEFLLTLPNVYERDQRWSGPGFHDDPTNWYRGEQSPYKNLRINLLSEFPLERQMKWNERPLIYAWFLTSLDNVFRSKVQVALTRWGISAPEQYLALIRATFPSSDPQMQSDLLLILKAVVMLKKDDLDFVSKAAHWVNDTIFPGGKPFTTHVLMRNNARAVVEIAIEQEAITGNNWSHVRPPYNIPFLPLELDTDMLVNFQGRESYPIEHDLAWYVIEEAYEDFIIPSGDNYDTVEADRLMAKYAEEEGLEMIGNTQLVYAATVAMMKKWGWEQEDPRESVYTQTTHGGISPLMSYIEKYIWQSVYHIYGHFADHIPIRSNLGLSNRPEDYSLVNDYSKSFQVENPGQYILNNDLYEIGLKPTYYAPHRLSRDMPENLNNEEAGAVLAEWVAKVSEIDWEAWIEIESAQLAETGAIPSDDRVDRIAIYNDYSELEDSKQGRSVLSFSTLIVDNVNLNELIAATEDKNTDFDIHELEFPENMNCRIDTDTYCTPRDCYGLPWLTETEKTLHIPNTDNSVVCEKAIMRTTDRTFEDGEKEYLLPNLEFRKLLGIDSTDGQTFLDEEKRLLGFVNHVEGSFLENQKLMAINKQTLEEALQNDNKAMVWIASIYKDRAMRDENEHLPFFRFKRVYFVWKSDRGYQANEIIVQDYKR